MKNSSVEPNVPMYSLIFVKIEAVNETIAFPIKCPTVHELGAILHIELSARVANPSEWTLARLERFMVCERGKDNTEVIEQFGLDELDEGREDE